MSFAESIFTEVLLKQYGANLLFYIQKLGTRIEHSSHQKEMQSRSRSDPSMWDIPIIGKRNKTCVFCGINMEGICLSGSLLVTTKPW